MKSFKLLSFSCIYIERRYPEKNNHKTHKRQKMKHTIILIALLILSGLSIYAQENGTSAAGLQFSKEELLLADGTVLPYRQMQVEGQDKSLVIYLHGGSSCGKDNETQLGEAGIDSIAGYLASHDIPSTFIVPQCTDRTKGWSGMSANVKALLDYVATNGNINVNRIYIFGGSMGGTGTWKMLSTYPDYFAAAMPCAANPTGMKAANVATTPVYNVMGLADKIMDADVRTTAENFTNQLRYLGDDVVYETVEGWSHETTCIQSYTSARLDWIFSHAKKSEDGISYVIETTKKDECYYDLQGKRLNAPIASRIYIHNGKKVVVKQ